VTTVDDGTPVIYADTSALAKLVVNEDESAALHEWLVAHPSPVCTNAIGAVELRRLAARLSRAHFDLAEMLLARIDRIELTASALAAAGALPPREVRTLDALHVASAAELSELEVVLTYDVRMSAAARGVGLEVASPGRGGIA